MFSKTLILSSQDKFIANSPRAILTIFKENNKTFGKIRLYNLDKIDKGVKIGILVNEQVFKSDIVHKDDYYMFEINNDIDINSDIYCALIDTEKNSKVVLCGGSYSGMYFTDEENPFDDIEENISQQIDQEVAKNDIEENSDCSNCKNCEYKDYFFKNTPTQQCESNNLESEEDPLLVTDEPKIETAESLDISQQENAPEQDNNFLSSIVEQLEEMFKEYPLDEQIMSIIPNSKIVKVEDVENTSYVVGTLFDDDGIKYLVYGVPARYNTAPPQEFDGNYQWLALDPDDPSSDGYYLLYTDITNGKPVKIKVE